MKHAQQKIRVGVIFGGKSAEYDISLQSARNVIQALDKSKYDIVLIGMDKRGQFYIQELIPTLPNQIPPPLVVEQHMHDLVTFMPGQNHTLLTGLVSKEQVNSIDVVFPVVHGSYGEDGCIQGLLKLANVPFVGSDVLGSSICMDKDVAKRLARDAGIAVAKFITLHRRELPQINTHHIIAEVGLPCFVKPANAGSSVGVSKVKNAADLLPAIEQAMEFDSKVLVEAAIKGREIECGVLGNDEPIASLPGEIVPHHEFYSYNAKYLDPEGAEVLPVAELSPAIVSEVQATAIKIFRALECDGMARVDFFLQANGKLIFNEINTIPGFTHISQYPSMWQASGVSYSKLLDKLIQLALERFDQRQMLKFIPQEGKQ